MVDVYVHLELADTFSLYGTPPPLYPQCTL